MTSDPRVHVGGDGDRGQILVHLQKVVFLGWSFLEVYFFATTYQKAFILGPKVTYPTVPLSLPYPTLPLSLPHPYPTPTRSYPTLPVLLRIHTHAHNQASHSRATLSCDSSYLRIQCYILKAICRFNYTSNSL